MYIDKKWSGHDTITMLTTVSPPYPTSAGPSMESPLSVDTTIGSLQITYLSWSSQTSFAPFTITRASSIASTAAPTMTSPGLVSATSASPTSIPPSHQKSSMLPIVLPVVLITAFLFLAVTSMFLYWRHKLSQRTLELCPYQNLHRLWSKVVLVWNKAKQTRIRNRGIRARSRAGSDTYTDEKLPSSSTTLRRQRTQRQRWSDHRYSDEMPPKEGLTAQDWNDLQYGRFGKVRTPTSPYIGQTLSTLRDILLSPSEPSPNRMRADTGHGNELTDLVAGFSDQISAVPDLKSVKGAVHDAMSDRRLCTRHDQVEPITDNRGGHAYYPQDELIPRDEELRKAAMERFRLQDLIKREQQATTGWRGVFRGPGGKMRAFWGGRRRRRGEARFVEEQRDVAERNDSIPTTIRDNLGERSGKMDHAQPEMPRYSSTYRHLRNSTDTDDLRSWFRGLGTTDRVPPAPHLGFSLHD